MKLLTFIFLLLAYVTVSAETFDTCLVYQYYANEVGKKQLVSMKVLNSNKQVIYESAHHYITYGNAEGTFITSVVPDGEYFSSYNDTKLVKEVKRFLGLETEGVDTIVEKYCYDDRGRKTMLIEKMFSDPPLKLKEGEDEIIITEPRVKYWHKPDTTFYYRGTQSDSIVKEEQQQGSITVVLNYYRKYDYNGRIVVDSIVDNTKYHDYSFTSKFQYGVDSYSKTVCRRERDCIRYEYTLNSAGLVLEEKVLTMGHADRNFRLSKKTENTYDTQSRLVKSRYFIGETLTTTHEFVYK